MHIVDGALTFPVIAATTALSTVGTGIGLRKLDYESIPRVGVLASVFFIASLIHVPVGIGSAHLLLNGLMGVLLGWAVFPAMATALLLQAILFGFGGIASLGANVLIMGLPGILCSCLFGRFVRSSMSSRTRFTAGFLAGACGIVFACAVYGASLLASGREFIVPVEVMLVAHVPVVIIEGFTTASVLTFLYRVRPEFLLMPLVGTVGKEGQHE